MSRERLADAYEEQAALFARLADTTAQIAHELRGIDSSAPVRADEPVARTGFAGAEAGPPPSASVSAPNAALGACPVHRTAWTVKAGGISRNGKPYKAFWKCAQRDGDAYCNEKPTKAWADSHPIPLEAVA